MMMTEVDGRKSRKHWKALLSKIVGDHLGTLVGVPIAQKLFESDPKLQLASTKKKW